MAHKLIDKGRMEQLIYTTVHIYELMLAPTMMPTPPPMHPQ